jgi:radical SAM-linked protein
VSGRPRVRFAHGTARPCDPRLPFPVRARTVPVLRAEDHPREMLVPVGEVVHDRLPIEVQRGCMRGCRFCQAGYLYRPSRERSVEECMEIAREGIAFSGHEEVSLLSLSTADHSQVGALVDRMSRELVDRGVSVSLPSLRADAFSVGLAEAVARVRKSGFTFAPEAGSERLRRVINKGISEADILSAVDRAMAAGWTGVKLYLMIGHPTETLADFEELAQLVGRIRGILRRHGGKRRVSLSFSPFVPKAHTPFQWERQDSAEETRGKLRWIKERLRGQGVDVKHHDPAETALEGMISRGGREVADLIEGAWRRGARFEGWSELLDFGAWQGALEERGWTLADGFRERAEEEELPWEVVSYGIERGYFLKERHKAYEAAETPECKHGRCSACGVCDFEALRNLLAPPPLHPSPDQRTSGPAGTALGAETPVRSSGGPRVRSGEDERGATVRLRYAKRSALRFTSHLELMGELDRVLRRTGVPLLYSEGFSARPRVSAGAPLATGWLSESEWLDLEVAGAWDAPALTRLLDDLNRHAAAGLVFRAAGVLTGKGPSLMAAVERSAYRATFPHPPFEMSFADLDAGCRTFLARADAPYARVRHGRTTEVDLRPLVHELAALDAATVVTEVRTASDGSAKPTELLEVALGVPRAQVPLILIQKTDTRLTGGATPLSSCAVAVGDTDVETRDSDQWQPAGDPRGDRGGRPAC